MKILVMNSITFKITMQQDENTVTEFYYIYGRLQKVTFHNCNYRHYYTVINKNYAQLQHDYEYT